MDKLNRYKGIVKELNYLWDFGTSTLDARATATNYQLEIKMGWAVPTEERKRTIAYLESRGLRVVLNWGGYPSASNIVAQ